MSRPRNPERDKEILKKIQKGNSYRQVASFFNMAPSSVFEAFYRAKKNVRLSTGKDLTTVR